MMVKNKFSLCVIDDKIPVSKLSDMDIDDTGYLDGAIINHCLKAISDWGDADLKKFISNIKDNKSFVLSGFLSHFFFFNYRKDVLFSPDIIVFDWDVGDGQDSAASLLTILKEIYCMVVVFTGADNEEFVRRELEQDKFKIYQERLKIIRKGEENSVEKLKKEICALQARFSFKYGSFLKLETEKAISQILGEYDKLSYAQFINLFGEEQKTDNKVILSGIEFVEIIAERLKDVLNSSNFWENMVADKQSIDNDEIQRLWHFRLYQHPQDDIVRQGDIIEINGETEKYLVISSDCHLKHFWRKNLGYLALVPIRNNQLFKERLRKYAKRESIRQFSLSSLTNPHGLTNITILPAVFYDEKQKKFSSGIVSLKEIYIKSLDIDSSKLDSCPLKFNETIKKDKRLHLTEPFLTPLLQLIWQNITGRGCPDFGLESQKVFGKVIKELLDE